MAKPHFIALCLLLLALPGCGGEGETVTTDLGPLVPSKRDYVVQADTVCGRADQAIQDQAKIKLGIDAADFHLTPSGDIVFLPGRAPSAASIRRFGTEVVLPTLRGELATLRALPAPRGDQAAVAAIYDRAEAGIERLASDPSSFNDRDAVRRALTEARRLGRQYGFFECGTYSGP